MKFFRVFFSILTGLLTSLFLAVTFFHYSDFSSLTDRLFLVLVPALAFGILFHQAFPAISAWMRSSHPSARPRASFLLSFLVTLNLTYGAVGFLREVLRTPFGMFLFTSALMTIGTTLGYFLIQRAADSFRNGFLSRPLNILLVLSLPVFWIAFIVAASQFPSMFITDYIRVPQEWLGLFLLTAFASIVLSLFLLTHHLPLSTRLSSFFPLSYFIHNLPGLYAAGMFFLIELIISRSLNHPALETNTVLFEADAGPWMTILASPESAPINRSVHPLSLILIRPLVRLVSGMMGEHYALGGMIVVSAIAALCVFMTWLFVKRATNSKTYAFLFAVLLGSTATHLLFGSLAENYIFGAAALIFFFLLIQSGETRFSFLVPAGLLLFGITITNIAQGIIALFFHKFGLKRLVQYALTVLALGILLTVTTNIIYPKFITFFFVPEDIAFEFNFVSSSEGTLSDPIRLSEPQSITRKLNVVARSVLLYGVVGPNIIEAVSDKPPFPTIDLKTFDVRTGDLASYRGLSNLPLALWLILFAGAFFMFAKTLRTSKHTPLMLGLLGVLGFNFLMHLFYGTELFLYTAYWVYALVLFIALAFSDLAEAAWVQFGLTLVLFALMVNNFNFIYSIFHALVPFYTATP
ncbi:MAG: hypothetical protein JNK32_01210 [Anaerolineales bacterium]|nr:hypothetical protein [Anaerolineales bacterium]